MEKNKGISRSGRDLFKFFARKEIEKTSEFISKTRGSVINLTHIEIKDIVKVSKSLENRGMF